MGGWEELGGSQWGSGPGWRACISHNRGASSPLGDTIGEERGLRASLRSRAGASARHHEGGVCSSNNRRLNARPGLGEKNTWLKCPGWMGVFAQPFHPISLASTAGSKSEEKRLQEQLPSTEFKELTCAAGIRLCDNMIWQCLVESIRI